MLRSPWFPIGLYWGIAAVAVATVTAFLGRRFTEGPTPVAGLLMSVATVAALLHIGGATIWLPVSLATIVGGAALAKLIGLPAGAWPFMLIPGAFLLAYRSGLSGPAWISHLIFPSVLLGSFLVIRFDQRDQANALGPTLALVSAVGLFLCAPDTDHALVLLGAGSLVAMTGWPLRITRLGAVGSPAWVAIFAWIVAVGGIGRLGPTLAGLACMGVLALEPLTRVLFPGSREISPQELLARRAFLLLGVHALFVLIASRVAGVRSPIDRTVLVLIVSAAAAMATLFGGTRRSACHGVAPVDEENS